MWTTPLESFVYQETTKEQEAINIIEQICISDFFQLTQKHPNTTK